MEVNLGGNRLGSGAKMKQELHNYNRATFNQEQDFKSSIAPGILYPFLCIPMTNGDTMEIDLDAFARTLPTKGPLFGSFKLQADLFSVPMRLYQAILHNNPINIGMNMNQVYFPKIVLDYDYSAPRVKGATDYDWQVNNTSLLKYLGMSGIGSIGSGIGTSRERKINAIPALAYYDIFKTYYANKQEENAYVIGPGTPRQTSIIDRLEHGAWDNSDPSYDQYKYEYYDPYNGEEITITSDTNNNWMYHFILYIQLPENYTGTINEALSQIYLQTQGEDIQYDLQDTGYFSINYEEMPGKPGYYYVGITVKNDDGQRSGIYSESGGKITFNSEFETGIYNADIELKSFPLANIDKMRTELLKHADLGDEFLIDNTLTSDWDRDQLPYAALVKHTTEEINWNSFIQNGLVVKTYQSDIFNNWIQTDWIEGENGIAAITAVDVSEGIMEMDALNLAQKVYNMLNRIATSDGTWEGYQEAVWTVDAVRKAESPIYEGGMSAEIMFEEVIANTAATEKDGTEQALGSLGGKGTMVGKSGGNNIEIKAREPIFVMGILSITPRICYTQGNEWYLTELDSFADLHVPALDGIGFQDLITEQMAWWDTEIDEQTEGDPIMIYNKRSAGKIVAWSNYQTAVDKAYGDFASPEGKGFMVLSRNYTMTEQAGVKRLADCTTYIDPAKFNYAFAYTDLAAQNFWVQIHSYIKTRRVMSAHQIPNL